MKADAPSSNERLLQSVSFNDSLEIVRKLVRSPRRWIERLIAQTLSANIVANLRSGNGCRTKWRLFVSSGFWNCLSEIRVLDEAPGMNTTEGLEGSPVASDQIFVPSWEVTNLLESMTGDRV